MSMPTLFNDDDWHKPMQVQPAAHISGSGPTPISHATTWKTFLQPSHTNILANSKPIAPPLWKRSFDLALVLLTAPLWLPLMSVIAMAIKIVSPGPALFRQTRIGLDGVPFMMLKFRSMHSDTETRSHETHLDHLIESDCCMTKLDTMGDFRLIRGARWLRAAALDELPQIFNVLRGDMSLVGPRPCTSHEFDRYSPSQRRARTRVLPGLTGYWQVNGKNLTTFREMVAMDLYYSRHLSFWLDLSIICKTLPVLLRQVFAARRNPNSK